MTNRLHVLGDGQQTCVIVTAEPSVTAAVKRQLLAAAEQAGLIDPHLVSPRLIQSPHNLKQLGLTVERVQQLEQYALGRLRRQGRRLVEYWR